MGTVQKVLIALASAGMLAAFAGQPTRRVEGNVLVSEGLPAIRVVLDDDFRYLGSFDFRIRDVAAGERYVFVDAADGRVDRLFIAQFEGFLPDVDDHYRYSFANAQDFAGHQFRHNTWAYSNEQSRRNNPDGEAALTDEFLRKRGLVLEDELMMSRFLTVPDSQKKHELILFYLENVSTTGFPLTKLQGAAADDELWQRISKALTARSLQAFRIE